jgi:HK97 family phage portal protein
METFGASFYGNGSIAGGFLKFPGEAPPEAKQNLRNSFEAIHRGPQNAYRMGILEQGWDYVKASVDPEDAQFLAGRQFQAIEICRIYRVPPNKVGDYSQAHLANVEASNLDYIVTTLRPWAVACEQVCSLKLLSQSERRRGYYFEHNLTALLRGDSRARVEYYTRMRDAGALCPDEIRDAEGLNPLEDGIGRVYLVPANLVPLRKMDVAEDVAEELDPDAAGAGAGGMPANGDGAAMPIAGGGKMPVMVQGGGNGNGNGKGPADGGG